MNLGQQAERKNFFSGREAKYDSLKKRILQEHQTEVEEVVQECIREYERTGDFDFRGKADELTVRWYSDKHPGYKAAMRSLISQLARKEAPPRPGNPRRPTSRKAGEEFVGEDTLVFDDDEESGFREILRRMALSPQEDPETGLRFNKHKKIKFADQVSMEQYLGVKLREDLAMGNRKLTIQGSSTNQAGQRWDHWIECLVSQDDRRVVVEVTDTKSYERE